MSFPVCDHPTGLGLCGCGSCRDALEVARSLTVQCTANNCSLWAIQVGMYMGLLSTMSTRMALKEPYREFVHATIKDEYRKAGIDYEAMMKEVQQLLDKGGLRQ